MALADFAGGVQGGLRELLARRLQQEAIQRQIDQQAKDNDLRERQFTSNEELKRAQLESLAQSRADATADRRMSLANTLADQIPAGLALDPTDPAVATLQQGGRGSLLTHQDPHLASTSTSGAGGMASPSGQPILGGRLRTRSSAAQPERFIKGASANQLNTEADNQRQAEAAAEALRHNRAMETKPTGAGTNPTLSPAMESQVLNRLTTQWTTASKPARDLERQVALMHTGLDAAKRGDLAQGAQAILVTFQKILDPTSVVRESEYMRSSAGLSLLNQVQGAYERLTQGGAGVPLPELEKFAALAQAAAEAQRGAYLEQTKERIGRTADHYQIPRDLVFEVPSEEIKPPPGTAGAVRHYNPVTGRVE